MVDAMIGGLKIKTVPKVPEALIVGVIYVAIIVSVLLFGDKVFNMFVQLLAQIFLEGR